MWVDKVWLFIMFDLPTESKKHKKNYIDFRKFILNDGFTQYQYSIYIRYCDTDEQVIKHINRIKSNIPDEGNVSIMKITDKQYSKIIKLSNNVKVNNNSINSQQILLL